MIHSSSPGRIAEEIGQTLMRNGHESTLAYGRGVPNSQSTTIKIGSSIDVLAHGLKSRLLDRHGLASASATRNFLDQLDASIDLVHLHNLHGYYIHYPSLFSCLKEKQLPVVWTFHDCWPFTGHCSYFDSANCEKWKTECHHCPKTTRYPKSYFVDNSRSNYRIKRETFNGLKHMTVVTPSHWLKQHVKNSFLKGYPVEVIHNGVDLDTFTPVGKRIAMPRTGKVAKKMIMGIASVWDQRKGLTDFLKLSEILPKEYQIVLIGLNDKQLKNLPSGIKGIKRTEDVQELAAYYRSAFALVNPTYQDNFPTTNIEALACGTPVITYETGGSPEAIDEKTGVVVEQGNVEGILRAIRQIAGSNQDTLRKNCRTHAEGQFSKDQRYLDYLRLYEKLMNSKLAPKNLDSGR